MGDVTPIRQMNDSLRSVVAGLGDPLRDKMAMTTYGLTFIDDYQLAAIYKSNWLGRKIVDIPAMDSIRKGRDWQAEQDQIELIEAEEKRLDFWRKLLEVKIKARLWGGAALFIGTGEQNLMEPLNVERMGKGGIRYLTVLSRRDVTAGQIDQDVLSEFHGKPAYYEVTGASGAAMVRIHPSRMAIFVGAPHGDALLDVGLNQGWGDSIIEAVYSAMKNADATAANIASLVFEANVDVFRIPDFMASLSDPTYQTRLLDRFTLAAMAKGINRSLILDKDEEYDRKTIAFATLPEVMQSFLQMAAGAADIPVTRLLGMSPAGMSATGESDMLNYYDRINSIQTLEMGPALYRLDECLIRTALGSRPADVWYSWAPLKQMSEKEIAEVGKMIGETVQIVSNAGIYTQEELRKVTTNAFVELGAFPGIDQAVAETDAAGGFDLGEADDDREEPPVDNATREQRAANDKGLNAVEIIKGALDAGKSFEEAIALADQTNFITRMAERLGADTLIDLMQQQTADAAPRTLYLRRDVLNVAEIKAWAKAQGFDTVQDGLHVTIIHTRSQLDWIKVGEDYWGENGRITIAEGGPRLMERFGDAIVLQFASSRLTWRHEDIKRMGAETDYPEYQPHITISWAMPEGMDLSKVEPYRGKIELGPEVFEEVNDDWKSKVSEA